MVKIDHSLFSQHEQLEKQHCKKCGGVVVLKHSKYGSFKCCVNCPNCDFTQTLTNNDGHVIKALGVACPECHSELVLKQGRFGMFIGCSAYPTCQHIEKREQEAQSQLGDIACPECTKGQLQEKQSRFGKRFYACNTYPKCKFAVNSKPVEGRCSECGYPLMLEKKSSARTYIHCANKKCQHKQN